MSWCGNEAEVFCLSRNVLGGEEGMVELKKIRNVVYSSLFEEYEARGTDFHFKVNNIRIAEMGSKRIGRACSILKKEGVLERRNSKPSPPIYKTCFSKNNGKRRKR